METTGAQPDHGPAEQLRDLEHAEALPYVVYPLALWWHLALFGLFFATTVLFFSSVYSDSRVLTFVSVTLMAAMLGAILAVTRLRYATSPRPPFSPTAPPEIRALYWRYLSGFLGSAALVALVWWWVGPFVAAGATFVLFTTLFTLYEHFYARAAAVVRDRLGIDAA